MSRRKIPASTSGENVMQVPERSFYVGDDMTEEDIKGEFKHGILKLFVPKKEAKSAVPERKFIAIEG